MSKNHNTDSSSAGGLPTKLLVVGALGFALGASFLLHSGAGSNSPSLVAQPLEEQSQQVMAHEPTLKEEPANTFEADSSLITAISISNTAFNLAQKGISALNDLMGSALEGPELDAEDFSLIEAFVEANMSNPLVMAAYNDAKIKTIEQANQMALLVEEENARLALEAVTPIADTSDNTIVAKEEVAETNRLVANAAKVSSVIGRVGYRAQSPAVFEVSQMEIVETPKPKPKPKVEPKPKPTPQAKPKVEPKPVPKVAPKPNPTPKVEPKPKNLIKERTIDPPKSKVKPATAPAAAVVASSPDGNRVWVRLGDFRTVIIDKGQAAPGLGVFNGVSGNNAVFESGQLPLN